MNIIQKILQSDTFKTRPPVLIDIGASGKIHKQWEAIARYSLCLAFDADDREFGYITKESSGFKKLFIYNCIVSDREEPESDFYLTKSPYCSSLLKPDNDSLKIWSFAEKFEVEKVIKLKTKTLQAVLDDLKLEYVDWFKTDSQGTDLRLFKSLPDNIRTNVIAAELEPGFIDSYIGEDKLYDILKYMETQNFWLADILVKGNQRITSDRLQKISYNNKIKKLLNFSLKESPGWAEMLYLNDFKKIETEREILLGWVFAVISKQYGFALELTDKPILTNSGYLNQMRNYTISQIKKELLKLGFMPAVFQKIQKLFK